MNRPTWKSIVFNEIHKIREEITKEIESTPRRQIIKKLNKEADSKLLEDGYKYFLTPQKYFILKRT